MGRLERFFLVDTLEVCQRSQPNEVSEASPRPRCWPSVAAALEDVHGGFHSDDHRRMLQSNPNAAKHPLLERHHFGALLPGILQLFGDSLLVIHQDSLRGDSHQVRKTWDRIAAFLGASPFPAKASFQRKNTLPGHRTDLCHNASLVRRFKRLLEPEFQAIEEATFGPVLQATLPVQESWGMKQVALAPVAIATAGEVWLHEQSDLRIEGRILGFDEYMNLVIDDAEEIMVKKKTRRAIGRILLKGDNICLMMNTGA
ncbi:SmE [Symbiodinium pilosum]|uniref:Sm protein E n=1 Tax=Symbiodinium pilosum TaxID=2952 RepID=A0A812XNC9_SYMPI|nr:SmE [Symbiodinium pilosum]